MFGPELWSLSSDSKGLASGRRSLFIVCSSSRARATGWWAWTQMGEFLKELELYRTGLVPKYKGLSSQLVSSLCMEVYKKRLRMGAYA